MKSSRDRSEARRTLPPGVKTVNACPSARRAPATWRSSGVATRSRNSAKAASAVALRWRRSCARVRDASIADFTRLRTCETSKWILETRSELIVRACSGRSAPTSLNHPARAQIADRAVGVSQFLQYGVRVLAECRRRAADGARRVRQLDRHAEQPERSCRDVLDRRDHVACLQLWIGQHLGDAAHGATGDAGLG